MPQLRHIVLLLNLAVILCWNGCGGEPATTPDGGSAAPPEQEVQDSAPGESPLEDGDAGKPASAGHPQAEEPPAPGPKPDFKTWATAFVAAPTAAPILAEPEQWFGRHFPADLARALVEEYRAHDDLGQVLIDTLKQCAAEGRTNLVTETFTDPNDWEATGGQSLALEKMSTPVPLHSIRLIRPGESKGMHIWSFSELGDRYVFVGKMLSVRGR